MMTPWYRLLAFGLLAASCSLEPNPSPYPMPGGADVWQPVRPDTTAGASDTASVADVTAPDFDVNVDEDTSIGDAADGSAEDTEDLEVTDDAETTLDVDGVDDTDTLPDLDVIDELDAVGADDATGGEADGADALEDDGDAAISELDVQSRVELD